MGIAILSGVIASMESSLGPKPPRTKWESHTPGTSTPIDSEFDPSLARRFIACVNRPETADKLRETFGGLRYPVEVVAGQNLAAVREADVVILWCASVVIRRGGRGILTIGLFLPPPFFLLTAANHNWHTRY
jgi:pyrroline-5-carboxylate reductase